MFENEKVCKQLFEAEVMASSEQIKNMTASEDFDDHHV